MNNSKSNQEDFLYSIGADMTLQIPRKEISRASPRQPLQEIAGLMGRP